MSATAKNPVFWAASRVPWWAPIAFATLYASWFWTVGGFGMNANILALVAVLVFVLLAMVPRRIEVGAEGLRVAWLGVSTVRYDAVVRAAPYATHDVMLTLSGGARLRVMKSPFGSAAPRAVLERLWTTLSVGAEERLAEAERAILERGNRSLAEWANALSTLARAGAQYRLGIPLERLWRVVENPAIGAELRVAAAVTLLGSMDDATRARLDEIAATTVDEPLRAALVRVAESREASDLTVALAEVGAPAPSPRSPRQD